MVNDKNEILAYCRANQYFSRTVNLAANIEIWVSDFNIDILKEIKGLNRWCIANPKKCPQNVADFLLRNLEKAESRYGQPEAASGEILKQLGADLPTTPPAQPKTVDIAARKKFLADQAEALKIRNKKCS